MMWYMVGMNHLPYQEDFQDLPMVSGRFKLCCNEQQSPTSPTSVLNQERSFSDEKNKKKLTIKSSLIYTKPNRRNKSNSTSYVIKKKTNSKVVAHKVGKKERSSNRPIWVPKDVIINMKGHQMVWVPKET